MSVAAEQIERRYGRVPRESLADADFPNAAVGRLTDCDTASDAVRRFLLKADR